MNKITHELSKRDAITLMKALTNLTINHPDYWQAIAKNLYQKVHLLKPGEFVQILDHFDRPIKDEKSKEININKCEREFFERLTTLFPIHVKNVKPLYLIKAIEILGKKNLGTDRLYKDFIFPVIEKNIMKMSVG